jgi:NADH-quinone oxidoreductase subunit G
MLGTVTIDGIKVPMHGQRNVLEMVREAGIDLPTFCYHSELSVYGACRMCVVEDARGAVLSSCSTPPADGMVVRTNTPRLMHIRKMMLELILANHDRDCTTCVKNGQCKLQDLCARFGVDKVRFPARERTEALDLSTPSLVRDNNKCILCGDCVRMCSEVQGIGAIDFAYRGAKARVTPAYNRGLGEVNCVNCGQCVAVCPTGALTVRQEIDEVYAALRDPKKQVVVQVAPAVRVAIGEAFGMEPGAISTGQMVAAIKRLGFNQVFDTTFTADLTTVEETGEFINRVLSGERLPQFTSCCPAWVKCAEQYYPEKLNQLSSCRSPQAMFGSLLKKYYTKQQNIAPTDLFVVSVMPCTAKKFEAQRPEFTTDDQRDVDAVLTTQELASMIKSAGIMFKELEEEAFDSPFGFGTGAGVIYGMTGGVATAVVREATYILTKERVTDVDLQPVENLPGVRAAELKLGERTVRLAVVSGLGNARRMVAAMDKGEVQYDIVEVMACPGGCAGGGGQPLPNEMPQRLARAKGLRTADRRTGIRLAQDNLLIKDLYREWLDKPNSETAHHALHTTYGHRRRILGEVTVDQHAPSVQVKVCVGTSCYLRGARDILRRFSDEIEARKLEDTVDLGAAFCLEHCDSGPNVQINGYEYHNVREQDVPELLRRAVTAAALTEPVVA